MLLGLTWHPPFLQTATTKKNVIGKSKHGENIPLSLLASRYLSGMLLQCVPAYSERGWSFHCCSPQTLERLLISFLFMSIYFLCFVFILHPIICLSVSGVSFTAV